MKRVLCCLTTSVLIASACASPYQEPFSAEPIVLGESYEMGVNRLIILFDASGSIHSRREFPAEKAWVESFVQGMPDGRYEAALRSFGGDERRGSAPATFNRERLAATARGLRVIGEGTPLDIVLRELSVQLSGSIGDTAVLLVSDGVPNAPLYDGPAEPVLEAARSVIESANGEVCYHTVLAGNEWEGRPLLKSIAALTPCGSYRSSSSISNPVALASFEQQVLLTAAAPPPPLPSVAAPPPDLIIAAPADFDHDGILDANDG